MIFDTKLDSAEMNLNLQLRLLTPTPMFSFREFSRKHLPELSLPDDESFDITSVRDPGLFSSRTFLIKVCRSCCLLFRRVAEKT
ncbi:unnamed protein product [Tenebrio molitor]|nr:unnamed protein product [Tenebrio molitor]